MISPVGAIVNGLEVLEEEKDDLANKIREVFNLARIVRIDGHHAVQIRAALDRYVAKNGGIVADVEDDDVLADLHWLLFWFEWALAHCSVPAIANT